MAAFLKCVEDGFVPLVDDYEGVCNFMYLDTKGLVTTAIGVLIDPMRYAVTLPWVHKDMVTPATKEEIAAEWNKLKFMCQGMAQGGGGKFEKITGLRLTRAGLNHAVLEKRLLMEGQLEKRFKNLALWPGDGQMGLLSLSWAAGAAFHAPKFQVHADAMNFAGCADECIVHTARDPVNKELFRNAAMIMAGNLRKDVIYYPQRLWKRDDGPTPIPPAPAGPIPVELPGIPYVWPGPKDES